MNSAVSPVLVSAHREKENFIWTEQRYICVHIVSNIYYVPLLHNAGWIVFNLLSTGALLISFSEHS